MSDPSLPSMEIMDLNDDCWLTLLEYIPFEQCVKLVGKLNYRLDYLLLKRLKSFTSYELFLENAPPSFNEEDWKAVGMNLKSFIFNSCPGMEHSGFINILRPIFKSCIQTGNLTTLIMRNTWWHKAAIDALKPLMPQIMCLNISDSTFPNFKHVIEIVNVVPELHKLPISKSVAMPTHGLTFLNWRQLVFTYIGHGQSKSFFTVIKVTIETFDLPIYVLNLSYNYVTEQTQEK